MVAVRMKEALPHQSVLLAEAIDALAIKPDGIYVDATFGRGGHAKAILDRLSPTGRLLALDKDPDANVFACQHFSKDKRFTIQKLSFSEIEYFLKTKNVYGNVDGILFDLGVSSPQLDQPERGFSFMREGQLDMRMDNTMGINAADWLKTVSEKDLADVLKEYGEERYAKRIAKAIIKNRDSKPIETTGALAEIISSAHPAWQKGKHPATQSFQAIRMHVNNELKEIEQGLKGSVAALKKGGRLCVISFHSLEDRIVKHFMRQYAEGTTLPRKLPVKHQKYPCDFKVIGRAIKPSDKEIQENPRARSAKLRIGEKLV